MVELLRPPFRGARPAAGRRFQRHESAGGRPLSVRGGWAPEPVRLSGGQWLRLFFVIVAGALAALVLRPGATRAGAPASGSGSPIAPAAAHSGAQ